MSTSAGGPEFVIVDGEDMIPVPRAAIAPPAMNFGQLHRWKEDELLIYSCAMKTTTFIALLSDWFDVWREDMIEDLEFETPKDGTAEAYWHAIGAPALEDLILADPALAASLLRPQALDLCQLLGAQGNGAVRYGMMSVDALIVTPNAVRMDGLAMRMG